jgi:P pilus assembly chaperone PapD
MQHLRGLAGLLLVSALLTGPRAGADMVLSEVILDLQAGEQRKDLEVWNSGDEPLYIQVEVSQVLDPESESPQRRKLEDPRTAGMLVSPVRMVLTPDERKLLRVVVRKPATERDLVYRVSLVPKENPVESDEQLALKVLIGYEVLVIVRPRKADPRLSIERSGRELRFANSGNSSVLIRKLTQCEADEGDCLEIPGNRLYAGESWTVELPMDGPVQVFQSFGSENSVRSY